MRIIDARSRPPIPAFLNDRTYTNLERTLRDVRARGWAPTPAMEQRRLDIFFAEMEEAGIERIGVPGRVPNRWWGGAGNDPVMEFCREYPDRSFLLAAVHPFEPASAERIATLRAAGAKGIVVEPGIADEPAYLDDRRMDPVCEACAAAGLPLLVMGGGETGPDLSFSDPVRFDRLAVRFPSLQLVNVHAGWPYVQETVGVAWRRANVWVLGDVYFPGLPGEADYLLAIRTFLRDRFVFATGFPFVPMKAAIDRCLGFGLPAPILEGVLAHNAARLFHL